MKIELIQLSPDNGLAEYQMLQDIGCDEYGFTNEVNSMPFYEYKAWLKQQDAYSKGQDLPEGWIPQTTYFLYIDDKPVGIGRIRHRSSESLERIGVGNLGYGIAKAQRGKGYGSILFEYLLTKCKAFGYAQIKLFPAIDNEATNRVMQKFGAILLGTLNDEKNVYKIPLK